MVNMSVPARTYHFPQAGLNEAAVSEAPALRHLHVLLFAPDTALRLPGTNPLMSLN
jgi:hypothetical protein